MDDVTEQMPLTDNNGAALLADELMADAPPVGVQMEAELPQNVELPTLAIDPATGKPKMKKDGSGFAKKRGRKRKTIHTSPLTSPGSNVALPGDAGESETVVEEGPDAAAVATDLLLGFMQTTGNMIGGDEWNYREGEEDRLRSAWYSYFTLKQIKEPPAWLLVTFVTGAYIGSRVTAGEKTRSKLGRMKDWMLPRMSILWAKIRRRKVIPVGENVNYDNRDQ